jgi:hypothetical protein
MGAESDDRQRPVRLPSRAPRSGLVLPREPVPVPVGCRRCRMSVRICDRCGDVTLDGERCTCTTPYSLSEVRRRYQVAVESARLTASRDRARVESGGYRATAANTWAFPAGPNSVADHRATPHRTAAAAVSGERAQARVPGPESISRPSSGTPGAHTAAAPPTPHEPRPALDPDWLRATEQAAPAPIDDHEQGRRR